VFSEILVSEGMASVTAKVTCGDVNSFPAAERFWALAPASAKAGKWPEIWIASHGPRMLRITGRYADAWFPVIMMRPKNYAAGLETIRSAASDAGRDPTSILPATGLFVFTGRSRDEVDEALSTPFAKTLAFNVPGKEWTRHGAQHPMGRGFHRDARHSAAGPR